MNPSSNNDQNELDNSAYNFSLAEYAYLAPSDTEIYSLSYADIFITSPDVTPSSMKDNDCSSESSPGAPKDFPNNYENVQPTNGFTNDVNNVGTHANMPPLYGALPLNVSPPVICPRDVPSSNYANPGVQFEFSRDVQGDMNQYSAEIEAKTVQSSALYVPKNPQPYFAAPVTVLNSPSENYTACTAQNTPQAMPKRNFKGLAKILGSQSSTNKVAKPNTMRKVCARKEPKLPIHGIDTDSNILGDDLENELQCFLRSERDCSVNDRPKDSMTNARVHSKPSTTVQIPQEKTVSTQSAENDGLFTPIIYTGREVYDIRTSWEVETQHLTPNGYVIPQTSYGNCRDINEARHNEVRHNSSGSISSRKILAKTGQELLEIINAHDKKEAEKWRSKPILNRKKTTKRR